jgi:hypothetical protein
MNVAAMNRMMLPMMIAISMMAAVIAMASITCAPFVQGFVLLP